MTTQQYLDIIALDLGLDTGTTEAEKYKANLATLWEFYAAKARMGNSVRLLYVKRHTLDALLGGAYKQVYYQDGDVSEQLGQIFDHLMKMRADVQTELLLLVGQRLAAAPAVGPIERQFPIEPEVGEPDPNERALRGDPLRRPWPPR